MGFSRTGSGFAKNEVSARAVPTGARSTSSTTYIDWPDTEVLSVSFTKLYADTDVIVEVAGSFYTGAGTPTVTFGAQINGTDYDAFRMAVNESLSHKPYTAITAQITGLAAGTYTVKLRAKTSANSISADTGDFNSMRVTEVL